MDEIITSPKRETILPDLSRSFKSKPYLPQKDDRDPCVFNGDECRKRKRTARQPLEHDTPNKRTTKNDNKDDAACFEIRKTKSKGIGMFATRNISCGDIIIVHEEPIVHCLGDENDDSLCCGFFCDRCAAPVGTLRNHHIVAPPSASSLHPSAEVEVGLLLPYLEDDDLVFTSAHSTCGTCNRVVWCSDECRQKGEPHHLFLCTELLNDPAINNFLEVEKNNRMIFRLAMKAITLSLSKYKSLAEETKGKTIMRPEQFFWWKDYGSHPCWWEVGSSDSKQEKKQATNKFCSALQSAFLQSNKHKQVKQNIDGNNSATTSATIIPEKVMRQICSFENIGSLLGMLQCNVMEFDYPSPFQQYMEHVEDFLDNLEVDNGNTDDVKLSDDVNEEGKRHMLALEAGCQWLKENIRNSSRNNNNEKIEGINSNNHEIFFSNPKNDDNHYKPNKQQPNHQPKRPSPSPVLGSGLYPLLTLANHDCHPNASIEVLRESCRASMVALRDIEIGEEICITYVPNGGVGGGDDNDGVGDNGKYFRHFEPTRTWKWLNSNDSDVSYYDGDNENDCRCHEEADSDCSNDCKHYGDDCDGDDDDDDINDDDDNEDDSGGNRKGKVDEVENPSVDDKQEALLEGLDEKDRAKALLEYGFECKCNRCMDERKT